MNKSLFLAAFQTFTACLLLACSPPVPAGDVVTGDAVVLTDTPTATPDVRTPLNSPLLGRCRDDSDCSSGTCETEAASGWSGGMCSHTCMRDDECSDGLAEGVSARCMPAGARRICMRACLNGYDCGREGYTCLLVNPAGPAMREPPRFCRQSCTETSCVWGTRCNPWSGACEAMSVPTPPMGQDVGEPCVVMGTMNNCRSGQCVPAQNSRGQYTGWNNGYCTSSCTLPVGWNNSNLWPMSTFPRANCPERAICFPDFEPGIGERDPGTCYHECRSDADCRVADGYACRKSFMLATGARNWQNGFCLLRGCTPGMDASCGAPGLICEAQQRVQNGQTVTVGVCRPPGPPVTDPGPEAGVADVPNAAVDVPNADVPNVMDVNEDGNG